ncbi:MAG: hypothetical protein ACI4SH_08235 [Candidatus Scatosoma sp.]
MKSFRDYAAAHETENNTRTPADGTTAREERIAGTGSGHAEEEKVKITAETLTKQIAAAYRGKNSQAVLSDIVSSAERGKKEGTLTNAEIDAFYRRFAPMLNFVQRKKLSQIVEQLKRI